MSCPKNIQQHWVKSGWMWESKFSSAGAMMTIQMWSRDRLGNVWAQLGECLQAWQKFWKLLLSPWRYNWTHLVSLSQVNYLVLTLRWSKVTTVLVWTCPECTVSILNLDLRTNNHLFRIGTVGHRAGPGKCLILDRGNIANSNFVLRVYSRQLHIC